MVGWHHRLNGRKFEQAPGDSEGRKPGMLQSIGSPRVRHNLVTKQENLNTFTFDLHVQKILFGIT